MGRRLPLEEGRSRVGAGPESTACRSSPAGASGSPTATATATAEGAAAEAAPAEAAPTEAAPTEAAPTEAATTEAPAGARPGAGGQGRPQIGHHDLVAGRQSGHDLGQASTDGPDRHRMGDLTAALKLVDEAAGA